MKKILVLVLTMICYGVGFANPLPTFQILPQPQQMKMGSKGVIKLSDLKYIVATDGAQVPTLGSILDGFPRYKRSGSGVTLNITTSGLPESEESYSLTISKSGVVINARTQAGLFYGCATLEQMLEDCRDFGLVLPETEIVDYPNIDFRAVYFDTKHHLSRAQYYYEVIDRLAHYKVNHVIWEIEDKLGYERHREIGSPNALSKQEVQAICRYAYDRNIIINPLIQGLGHAGFILKHHWDLREKESSDWEFCPSNPKTYEMQFDLYRDAMEAMPYSKYLHIGGDEITEIGICDRCVATGKSGFELQMEWLKKVSDFAIESGKTPIFWDDMPLKHGDLWGLLHRGYSDEKVEEYWSTEKLDKVVELFPKNCIYMRWHYGDPTILANRKVLEWYKTAGLDVMAATSASPGEAPFMPRDDSRAANIKNFSELVVENNLSGIVATAWDDGSSHWETVMRGFTAQGEYGWNPTGRSVEEFKSAHAQREYGFVNGEHSYLDTLEELAFFFDGALVVEGRRNPAWQVDSHTLMELPNKDKIGEWSEKYSDKLAAAHEAQEKYISTYEGLQTAKNHALRNRYTLDVYEQNLELFYTPAKILLALERYDQAESKEVVIEEISSIIDEFYVMKQNLIDVFSVTRFMEAPNGYIADMNHHNHLAALTLNSDWIFLYEGDMIKELKALISNE